MPERVPLHLHWDPESIRTEVLDRAENAVLSAGSGRVRAMAVPLFRAVDKELEQAVRIESDSSLAGATVSIAPDGGSPIDRVTLGEQGFDHLFVPEVNTPFQFMLTLETGDEAISAPIVARGLQALIVVSMAYVAWLAWHGWRAMRDGWYDARLNNRDWNAVRAKYRESAGECLGQVRAATPDPQEHPGLFVVGDYLFDSTINGVFHSANTAAGLTGAYLRSSRSIAGKKTRLSGRLAESPGQPMRRDRRGGGDDRTVSRSWADADAAPRS